MAACSALFLAHVRLMGCQMFDTYKGFLDSFFNFRPLIHVGGIDLASYIQGLFFSASIRILSVIMICVVLLKFL